MRFVKKVCQIFLSCAIGLVHFFFILVPFEKNLTLFNICFTLSRDWIRMKTGMKAASDHNPFKFPIPKY